MSVVPGVPVTMTTKGSGSRARTLKGLAGFFAQAWGAGARDEMVAGLDACSGRVGRSVGARLVALGEGLPGGDDGGGGGGDGDGHGDGDGEVTTGLRAVARRVGVAVRGGGIDGLPVVLTHGDLRAGNLLVGDDDDDDGGGELVGVVDWAEAEYLPFGMALYGVEHLLGRVERSGDDDDDGRMRFVYCEGAKGLREGFFELLRSEIVELREPRVWEAVMLSRAVGILLWHGIAWDEGRLDRVVNWEQDAEELAYLEAFLHVRLDGSGSIG
jgi:hypothetical protein